MKKSLGVVIAAAGLALAGSAYAQAPSPDDKGASQYAPGQNKEPGKSAKDLAPGQATGPANKAAPGQQMHNENSSGSSSGSGSSGSSTGTGSDSDSSKSSGSRDAR